MEHAELTYRLAGVDPEEGVDPEQLASQLESLHGLITESARIAGIEKEVQIKVLPFREGSFVIDFLLSSGLADLFGAVDLLTSKPVDAFLNLIELLGFVKFVSGKNIPSVVRRVRGMIDKHVDNGDGTYTYGTGKDALTVDETAHQIIQSHKVAKLYEEIATRPLAVFNGDVSEVNIYIKDSDSPDGGLSSGSSFGPEDKEVFDTYSRKAKELADTDTVSSTSITHGILLRPVSGSYGGAQKGYTFTSGQDEDFQKYKNVSIEDEGFRSRLEEGEARLTSGDLLQVDLEITQEVSRSGKLVSTYRILRVLGYFPLKTPRQMSFSDLIDEGDKKNHEES